MPASIQDQRTYEQYILTLAVIAITGLLLYTQVAKRLDWLAYDTATTLTPAPMDPDTVIIAIDEKSLNALGQWPWRRAIHAQLIDTLTAHQASTIALDIIFSERNQTYPEDDAALALSIKKNNNVILPVHIHPLRNNDSLSEILPLPELAESASALGHVHVQLDSDGVARGLYLNSGVGDAHWPSMSLAMAFHINPMLKHSREGHDQRVAPYVNINTQYRLIPFVGPAGSFPTYSYVDVLLGEVDEGEFKNKTILVGATAAGLGDVIPTPVSGLLAPMSGVELHANAYSAIMTKTDIASVTEKWRYLLTLAFILIPILVFPRLQPAFVMPTAVLLMAMVGLFSFLLLKHENIWFPPANSILGILVAYPLWSWQRIRHLNAFLNEELERLRVEPSLRFSHLAERPVDTIFESLVTVTKPAAYKLSVNGDTKSASNEEGLNEIKPAEPEKWLHDGQLSAYSFEKDNTKYNLCFKWNDSHDLQDTRKLLEKLDISADVAQAPRKRYERIANRITKVKEAISSLRDMRSFIFNGLEEMPDGVLVTDPVGTVIFCNGNASDWIGKSKDSIQGKLIFSLFNDQFAAHDNIHALLSKVLISGSHETIESQFGDRDLLIHCVPSLSDEQGDMGMIVNLSDITLIKQQQREKNELIDFLSHDVRSPLVSVLAVLDGVRTERIKWEPRVGKVLENHTKKSLKLSEQFLQLTRAEQVNENSFYEFDLVNAVENSIDSTVQQANAKNIEIQIDEYDPLYMHGNAELIERAVTNLLSNAIKYSDENTFIRLQLNQKNDELRLKIIDQGYGIAEHELPHIFNRFRRQQHSEKSGNKGTGLGLNFVEIVVTKHNGSIDVESELGQGSTFTLKFPAA